VRVGGYLEGESGWCGCGWVVDVGVGGGCG
jgi:hypothetical protein